MTESDDRSTFSEEKNEVPRRWKPSLASWELVVCYFCITVFLLLSILPQCGHLETVTLLSLGLESRYKFCVLWSLSCWDEIKVVARTTLTFELCSCLYKLGGTGRIILLAVI